MPRLSKRFVVLVAVFFAAIPAFVSAVDMSTEKRDVVYQNCLSAQGVLQRLQYNDAATRINRGHVYEALLNDYMTPLNSRLAVNGYSTQSAQLSGITSQYQAALSSFKNHYETYDDTVTKAIKTKCQQKPDVFYGYILNAQTQRGELATSAAILDDLVESYRKATADIQKGINS